MSLTPKAKALFDLLADTGTAPARGNAAQELIRAGLATKGKRGLKITPAGEFAAEQERAA